MADEQQLKEHQQKLGIMPRAAQQAMAQTDGMSELLISEILTKVNNAKDKPKKVAVLKQYNSVAMRQILKGAFDPKIEWDLPSGTPPYMANEAPAGTEHTTLLGEARKLWRFVKNADKDTSKPQRETMFIQMLEGLHQDDAKVLIATKDKVLHRSYKGLSSAVVKEAFGWNDDYIKHESAPK
tara:strand:- start:1348 stop:1893 length:546 start_codon:yes stop_codon:yes gene_type:complete